MIGIYDRDISRWYHLTWGKTVEHTILLGMGAIGVIMIMWTLGFLFNTDFRGHFMYHNDTLIFNRINLEPDT